MRSLFVLVLSALVAFPAAAQTTGRALTGIAVQEPGERLERLFSELKRARNGQAAERISNRIRQEWSRSGSASIDLLMQWAQEAMEGGKHDVALDLLDQVVTLSPAYAEGWNRRATVHFARQDHAKSMADIARTLRLEPRHFGALTGLAAILEDAGRKEAALHAYERVLDVYPMLRSAQDELVRLADELAGEGI